jgi:hypothetical protein
MHPTNPLVFALAGDVSFSPDVLAPAEGAVPLSPAQRMEPGRFILQRGGAAVTGAPFVTQAPFSPGRPSIVISTTQTAGPAATPLQPTLDVPPIGPEPVDLPPTEAPRPY